MNWYQIFNLALIIVNGIVQGTSEAASLMENDDHFNYTIIMRKYHYSWYPVCACCLKTSLAL